MLPGCMTESRIRTVKKKTKQVSVSGHVEVDVWRASWPFIAKRADKAGLRKQDDLSHCLTIKDSLPEASCWSSVAILLAEMGRR